MTQNCKLNEEILYLSISFIFILVNSILSLPLLVYGAYKRYRSSVIVVCLFLSSFTLYFVPPENFDLYRHYEAYKYYLSYGNYLYNIKDLYLVLLFKFGAMLELNGEFMFYISSFIYYFSCLSIALSISNICSSSKLKLISIAFFLIFSNTLLNVSGLRFTTGVAFILLSVYFDFFLERKKYAFIFFVLAALSHISLLYYFIVRLSYAVLHRFDNKKLWCSLPLISLLVGFSFFSNFIGYFFKMIETITGLYLGAEAYTTGEWGADSLQIRGYSSIGIFVLKAKEYIITLVCLAACTTFYKNSFNLNLYKIFVLHSSFSFLLYDFGTMYMRYQTVSFMILILLLFSPSFLKKAFNWPNIIGCLVFIKIVFDLSTDAIVYYSYFINSYMNAESVLGLGLMFTIYDYFYRVLSGF